MPTTTLTFILNDEGASFLLIKRDGLAKLIAYPDGIRNLNIAANEAYEQLEQLEQNPPTVEDPQPEKKLSGKTLQLPRAGKSALAIPIERLELGKEDDVDVALKVAGRLYDAGMWNTLNTLKFDDLEATAETIEYLTEDDLKLFSFAELNITGS